MDLIAVVDFTYSMASCIDLIPPLLTEYAILKTTEIESIGLVAFDDHDARNSEIGTTSGWPKPIRNFGLTENMEEWCHWLRTTSLGGGSDGSEAIDCALSAAALLSTDSRIWLITDSVPHGSNSGWDDYWRKGCPCGLTYTDNNFSVLLPSYSYPIVIDYWTNRIGEDKVILFDSIGGPVDKNSDLYYQKMDIGWAQNITKFNYSRNRSFILK